MKRLCFIHRLAGIAGPAAFQRRLAAGLQAEGHRVAYGLSNRPYDAVLVIGGTRQLAGLMRARRRGALVVQRLNGLNWLHRRTKTGLRHFLRAETNNLLLRLVRDRLADRVVYQSEFARRWWEETHGAAPVASSVVYNGVPLDQYTPLGPERRDENRVCLLLVEGNLAGGYEVGLKAAISLCERLQIRLEPEVTLSIAGHVPASVRTAWSGSSTVTPTWLGQLDPAEIPALDRSAHLLYAADLNPACPNSVIEALACGLPVVSFDTGSLPELVTGDAGRLAHYGGDPWQLDPPDMEALTEAAVEVIGDQDRFRHAARERALDAFGADRMVAGYLDAFGWSE